MNQAMAGILFLLASAALLVESTGKRAHKSHHKRKRNYFVNDFGFNNGLDDGFDNGFGHHHHHDDGFNNGFNDGFIDDGPFIDDFDNHHHHPIDPDNYYGYDYYYGDEYYDDMHPIYEFEGGDYESNGNAEFPQCEFLCEEKYCNPPQKRKRHHQHAQHRHNNARNKTRHHNYGGGCQTQSNNAKGSSTRPKCGVPSIKPEITINNGKIQGFFRHKHHHEHRHENIVNGNQARPNSYPWLVSIQEDNGMGGFEHSCGGSLIDDRHVITAAHCFQCGYTSKYRIAIGEHDHRSADAHTQFSCVKKVIIHESYDKERNTAFDGAIVVLATPVKFNDYVKPICLPSTKQNWQNPKNKNEKFVIAGWGYMREGGNTSPIMNEAVVKVMPVSQCKQRYPGSIGPTMMCASSPGIDTCQGDSGGPLMAFRRRWVLAGVVSWGNGCARRGFPGVYAHVPSLLPWFKKNINCPACFNE